MLKARLLLQNEKDKAQFRSVQAILALTQALLFHVFVIFILQAPRPKVSKANKMQLMVGASRWLLTSLLTARMGTGTDI
jgi:hypothetical protein